MAGLAVEHLSKQYPDRTRAVDDLSFEVADGEFLVVVGPSGSGKSTVLRLLAGLETPSGGEIRIDGRIVTDASPQQRNVAMVFQDYALYPHMSVRRNLEFPLRMRGLDRTAIAHRVAEMARLLDLGSLLERRPYQLSGGQRQRVAMGRALVREPVLFLMDEPLSNLDAKLRVQIRGDIAALQRRLGVTTVYVTHDQVEAMTLGHRVAVLEGGRLQQLATPQILYEQPANLFVAGFIGSPAMNLLQAELLHRDHRAHVLLGELELDIDPTLHGAVAAHRDGPLIVGIRPEALRPDTDGPQLTGTVVDVESLGHETIVYFTAPVRSAAGAGSAKGEPEPYGARCAARLAGARRPRVGEAIRLRVDVASLHWFTPRGDPLIALARSHDLD